jgi:hypothetical protein
MLRKKSPLYVPVLVIRLAGMGAKPVANHANTRPQNQPGRDGF